MDETNPPTGAFVDFPLNQPPRPAQPTPEQVAGRDGGDVKREADERRAREAAETEATAQDERRRADEALSQIRARDQEIDKRTIPITERGSTARVPAPGESEGQRQADLETRQPEMKVAADAEKNRLAAEPSNLTPDEKAEYESHRPAPEPIKDVVRTPEEAVLASLQAPGHNVGDAIYGPVDAEGVGLFKCGIDALGRVWRVENTDDNDGHLRLVLAGRLDT